MNPADQSAATSYTTIDGDHRHELEIKRSRFITHLRRVETEEAARALVAELRKTHFDARHHCSAFILGPDRSVQRSNDDGEPSGTAGLPMLDALAKRETSPGSLTCSTSSPSWCATSAASCWAPADWSAPTPNGPRRWIPPGCSPPTHAPVRGGAGYADARRLENDLRAAGTEVLGTGYGPTEATLKVALRDGPEESRAFAERLAALTAGASTAVDLGTEWVDLR